MVVRERARDRENERAIIAKVREILNLNIVQMHKFSQFDYAVIDEKNSVKAWIEVKSRNMSTITQFDDIILDASKYYDMARVSQESSIPFVLLISADDGIYSWRYEGQKPRVSIGGNRRRGLEEDIKAVVHIPSDQFKKINTPADVKHNYEKFDGAYMARLLYA